MVTASLPESAVEAAAAPVTRRNQPAQPMRKATRMRSTPTTSYKCTNGRLNALTVDEARLLRVVTQSIIKAQRLVRHASVLVLVHRNVDMNCIPLRPGDQAAHHRQENQDNAE